VLQLQKVVQDECSGASGADFDQLKSAWLACRDKLDQVCGWGGRVGGRLHLVHRQPHAPAADAQGLTCALCAGHHAAPPPPAPQALDAALAQLYSYDPQQGVLALRSTAASGADSSQMWAAMELLGSTGQHLQHLAGGRLHGAWQPEPAARGCCPPAHGARV
jgi:hypothetical protein